jgi:ATP/maltotriose-dependent transcriptional regulator MalT
MSENVSKGYTYCATCERDLKDNNFKIGYTSDLKERLNMYNNNPANYRDEFYYIITNEYESVEEAHFMEQQIHKLLTAYRIKKNKEWFHLENHDLIRIAFDLKCNMEDIIHTKVEKRKEKQDRNNKITELYISGLSVRQIAKKLNVSKSTVGRICLKYTKN